MTKLYVVEIEVDDTTEYGSDDEFMREEIHARLEDLIGVIDISIDDLQA